MSLVNAAKKLGQDRLIMQSYIDFQTKKFSWFFSPNPYLKSATKKPKSLNNWEDWYKMNPNQKRTLASLAGFKQDATDIKAIKDHFNKLNAAYNKWKINLYSVFWGNAFTGTWTCNIFVGDAIYMATGKKFTAGNGHYFDPQQIKAGASSLRKRKKVDEIKAGDIVVMSGGAHVEIVTKLKDYIIADKGFCSIGGGRSFSSQMGTEKCDNYYDLTESRELKNIRNTFFYL